MWAGTPFHGCKIALLDGSSMLVYLRDDKPEIPYPAQWDLPGGGREGAESPFDCVCRELVEEFGFRIQHDAIIWEKFFPPSRTGAFGSYFFAGTINDMQISSIVFGTEGQTWTMMNVNDYIDHPRGIDFLKWRLKEFLESSDSGRLARP